MQLPRGSGRMGRLCVHWAAGAALELVVVGGWASMYSLGAAGAALDVVGLLGGAPLLLMCRGSRPTPTGRCRSPKRTGKI